MQDVVIVGCGGHGRELLDTIRACNQLEPTWSVLGFVDDAPQHPDRVERLDMTVLGPIEWLTEHPGPYALGVGTSTARFGLSLLLSEFGASPISVIHPRASIGCDCTLGDGVVIYERSTVTTNVIIGEDTHLNVGCTVQHDSVIGAFVQFSPGVFGNGDCVIGDEVFLGTGVIVTRGCSIGSGVRVGAGAVVLDDVAPGATVYSIAATEQ